MTNANETKTTRPRARVAQLVAEAVNVLCPECGEPQPNPDDGSHLWLPEHFKGAPGRPCASCDAPLLIHATRKVQF